MHIYKTIILLQDTELTMQLLYIQEMAKVSIEGIAILKAKTQNKLNTMKYHLNILGHELANV